VIKVLLSFRLYGCNGFIHGGGEEVLLVLFETLLLCASKKKLKYFGFASTIHTYEY
jgi:hypothetical protein